MKNAPIPSKGWDNSILCWVVPFFFISTLADIEPIKANIEFIEWFDKYHFSNHNWS